MSLTTSVLPSAMVPDSSVTYDVQYRITLTLLCLLIFVLLLVAAYFWKAGRPYSGPSCLSRLIPCGLGAELLINFVFLLFDQTSDIIVTVVFFQEGDLWWAYLSLCILIFSGYAMFFAIQRSSSPPDPSPYWKLIPVLPVYEIQYFIMEMRRRRDGRLQVYTREAESAFAQLLIVYETIFETLLQFSLQLQIYVRFGGSAYMKASLVISALCFTKNLVYFVSSIAGGGNNATHVRLPPLHLFHSFRHWWLLPQASKVTSVQTKSGDVLEVNELFWSHCRTNEEVLCLALLEEGRVVSAGEHEVNVWNPDGSLLKALPDDYRPVLGGTVGVRDLCSSFDHRKFILLAKHPFGFHWELQFWALDANKSVNVEVSDSTFAIGACAIGILALSKNRAHLSYVAEIYNNPRWVSDKTVILRFETPGHFFPFAVFPDGKIIVHVSDSMCLPHHCRVSLRGKTPVGCSDGRCRNIVSCFLWDVENTESGDRPQNRGNEGTVPQRHRVSSTTHVVSCLAAFPNGRFVCGHVSGRITVWNQTRILSVFQGHSQRVTSLAVCADLTMASGSEDGTVMLWSAEGSCLRVIRGHESAVTAVRALPNGTIVSASRDSTVRMWPAEAYGLQPFERTPDEDLPP